MMRGAHFESANDVVRSAEEILQAWHHVLIDHGELELSDRTKCRRVVLELSAEMSHGKGCQVSMTENAIELVIGPPDARTSARDVIAAVMDMNPGTWQIRHWTA